MIDLYECPNCGKDSSVFTARSGEVYCPACAPVPERVPYHYVVPPHDFVSVLGWAALFGMVPILKRAGGVVKLTNAQARAITSHGCVVGCDPQLAVKARTRE